MDNNGSVGIGTDEPGGVIDFRYAGETDPAGRFMIPPIITTTLRSGLATAEGAIIYNSTTKKHQGYNGTGWFDLY
jgi:hypothetical protein